VKGGFGAEKVRDGELHQNFVLLLGISLWASTKW